MVFEAINWNKIDDEKDLEVWDRLTANFWLPEKIPLSNDIPSWRTLEEDEKEAFTNVFTNLTLLDTLQGVVGAVSMIPDAETQHEEAVLTNLAFMERLAEGTEVLTPNGWVPIEKITLDHEIMQYDSESNEMTFTNPIKIYPAEHRERMYEISAKNGNARQVVSAGHRVYYEEKEKKNNECKKWISVNKEAEELLEVNLNSSLRRFRITGEAASEGRNLSVEERLIVAINADGSYKGGSTPRYTGEETGFIPCKFSFKKQRKLGRLTELAKEAGWGLRKVGKEQILEVPLEYVNREKEFFPLIDLRGVSKEWAIDFLEEVSHWDGHSLEHKGYVIHFTTTSKENSDFIDAVAALAGRRARTTVRVDDRSENFSDSYMTYIANRDTVSAQSMQIKEVAPAITYCVQVPTTFLLTRNGNTPVITGNCVHAKSYSSIFSTLLTTPEINDTFRWAKDNPLVQKKAEIINSYYVEDDQEKKKVASVMLESFLFYSGFYYSLWWAAHGKLTNSADIIKLILRDESIHGYYLGYKFQKAYREASPERQKELKDFTHNLMLDLYDNEVKFTHEIYDKVGLTEDVLKFVKYNANKALMNLGFDEYFPTAETKANPAVMSQLSPAESDNHDFFSGSGSSYVIGDVVETEDDDWDF